MKDLGMSWAEIKQTPRIELEGLLSAFSEYSILHSFDGYGDKDISEMAKSRPEVRSQYGQYIEANRNLKEKLGQVVKRKSIRDLIE
jgi:hypothetical protein